MLRAGRRGGQRSGSQHWALPTAAPLVRRLSPVLRLALIARSSWAGAQIGPLLQTRHALPRVHLPGGGYLGHRRLALLRTVVLVASPTGLLASHEAERPEE